MDPFIPIPCSESAPQRAASWFASQTRNLGGRGRRRKTCFTSWVEADGNGRPGGRPALPTDAAGEKEFEPRIGWAAREARGDPQVDQPGDGERR
jgi:hypothetical protein